MTRALPARQRVAFVSVCYGFLAIGLGFALWFVHIPMVVARLNLQPWLLGLVLLSISVGSLIMMPISAAVVVRFGAARPLAVSLPLFAASFPLPILAADLSLLFLATVGLGLVTGMLNTALNTRASDWEGETGRVMMPVFHGFYSCGALVGSLVGAWMLARPEGSLGWVIGAAGLLVLLALVAAPTFGPSRPHPMQKGERLWTGLKHRFLLLIAAFALVSDAVEGAVNEWSALYLHVIRELPEARAAYGFALFSLVMTLVRFFGAPLVVRLGDRRVLLLGGVLIVVGFATVLAAPGAWISTAGFGVVALGSANLIPVLTSLAGRVPGVPAAVGIAVVASAAIIGMLMGPPLIGFVTQGFGLQLGLGMPLLFGALVALGAAFAPWPGRERMREGG